jgi:hypothetical protein
VRPARPEPPGSGRAAGGDPSRRRRGAAGRALACALAAGIATAAVAARAEPEPPAVAQARALAREVEAARKAGKLRPRERRLRDDCPGEDVMRRLWIDAAGRVVSYEREAGSDDSARRYELLYDGAGRLRFAFVRGGAANGTVLEVRVYLDAAGRRVRETRRLVSGPGYTFPRPWPDEDLPRNPTRHFASAPACAR